jgi:hypothetical protein
LAPRRIICWACWSLDLVTNTAPFSEGVGHFAQFSIRPVCSELSIGSALTCDMISRVPLKAELSDLIFDDRHSCGRHALRICFKKLHVDFLVAISMSSTLEAHWGSSSDLMRTWDSSGYHWMRPSWS